MSAHRFRPSALVPALLSLALVGCILAPMEGCKSGRRTIYSWFHHRKAKSKSNSSEYADNVAQLVQSPKLAILKWADYSDYQQQVQTFYDQRNYELAWTRDGKPTATTTALIEVFTHADQKGLLPEDYDASRWSQRLARLHQILERKDKSDNAEEVIAQFDAAVTISTLRFISDLHSGRVNPQTLNFDIDVPAKQAAFDLPTFVNDQVVDSGDPAAVFSTVEPRNAMYAATEKALSQYLALAQQQAAQPSAPLPGVGGTAIHTGGYYAAVPALLARLQLEGDAGEDLQTTTYNSALSAAVKHYQQRHGYTADGRLTQQTVDSLNVPFADRVRAFNDSLERWRWLPDNFVNPRVLVNLPEFQVRTYNEDDSLAFKMKVVVGQAQGNHDTPMFVRSMRYVNFRPYWNLPTSIIKKELMRHINASGIGYLASHNYEVVTAGGQHVSNFTANDLEHGRYVVRQKPGPQNSLGLVKFMFPNEYDIYMHSTPEMQYFNLTRRDKSHGCIRLNDAEAMANWVLKDLPNWDADRIHEAMYGDADNKVVNLKTLLPVNITYLTANADEDGTIHLYDDIYGYDKQLEAALAKHPHDHSEHKVNPKETPGETL
ncbi:MAG: L,D-transpeptidase family protein [Acidobacteriaceae bacterium]|nr:L,D-transpeptidase family protein [Acidobacteriaceae bacterium]